LIGRLFCRPERQRHGRIPVHRLLATAGCFTLVVTLLAACAHRGRKAPPPQDFPDVQDVLTLPQTLDGYAVQAGQRLGIAPPCREALCASFRDNYFRPWTAPAPLFDAVEIKGGMISAARSRWYGENHRIVDRGFLRRVLASCALESFPSRNDRGIAVYPAHLRGLPTGLPLFARVGDYPFDQLEYPQMKLHEPLRVLHATRDGLWLFVETPYSCGWVDARAVALVDERVAQAWLAGPLLVVVRDFEKISDGRGGGCRAKVGTLLPLSGERGGAWEVTVASADDSRCAVTRCTTIPREAALPFPIPFDAQRIPLVGNQLVGEPYGWGEMYGLRDCSALLRDFFLPFGIWLPRTSADQIESVGRLDLGHLTPREKVALLTERGIPFLTLLFKPGHIMLYVGCDRSGRPLVFHNAWSIVLKDGTRRRVRYIGKAVVTTLEPGRELGLVPGSSLVDRVTAMGTITGRCTKMK